MTAVRRVYIAGPMSGIPDFNYPAFNKAADELRAYGYDVENPADNERVVKPNPEWVDYMRLSIAQLVSCDSVALLDGWETSRGAKIEHSLATLLGFDVRPIQEFLNP